MEYKITKGAGCIYAAKTAIEKRFGKELSGMYPYENLIGAYVASNGTLAGSALLHSHGKIAVVDKLAGLNGSGMVVLDTILDDYPNVGLMCKIENKKALAAYERHLDAAGFYNGRVAFTKGIVPFEVVKYLLNKETHWRSIK